MTPSPPTPPPATPQPIRVREVLDLALERPARERAAFIAGVCGDDDRLRDEVVSLMRALEAGGDLLEPPAAAPAPPAEPLTGLRFGSYQVAERVGEGGMGVVYRAEDTRLGRAVAVKALPPTVARDPHRRARFEHEARILASLNHPNIAAIHGVEDTARGPVLVLEFVPGETLAQRLTRGALAPDEAVATAIQIARGLEAAHAAGVVHRDLKPSNIQLTREGGVKILDFGVAKQAPAIAEADPSSSPLATMAGSLVGTAAYMSPEQARGRAVDRRADLWAFGCVLYEMLTGRRAFDGETPSDTVASVLRAEPDWSRLPAATPASVVRLLRRCLEKDPDLRQRDAGDARLELDGRGEPEPARVTPRRAPWLAVGGLLAAAAAFTAWSIRGGAERPGPSAPVHFELHADPAAPIYLNPGGAMSIAPDGRSLVFAGGDIERSRLYARSFSGHETVAVPGTDGASTPCFSPDGRWIAFYAALQVRRVPVGGGGAEVLVSGDASAAGLAWDERGITYCGLNPWGLRRVLPGRAPELLAELDPVRELYAAHPEPLPGSDVVLLTIVTVEQERASPRVESIRVRTGERRTVATEAAGARFLAPDRLVFWQAGALVSAPFDPETLRLTDAPVPLLRPLAGGEFIPPTRFAVSGSGVLATLPENIRYDLTRLAWFQLPEGSWTEITRGDSFDSPRLSPDGTRIAMLIGRSGGDIWIHDLIRGNKMVLTSGAHYHHLVWTPDGRSLVFTSQPVGAPVRIVKLDADRSGPPQVLWEAPEKIWAYPTDFLPDGRIMLTIDELGSGPIDLYVFDPGTAEPPRPLMPTIGHRFGARRSRDGTMIAYTSEETGSMEVYIHRYPSLEGKVRVSSSGGYRPVWADNDTKIFFRYVDKVMVADVDSSGDRLVVSAPRLVAEHLPDARYDVDADGRRLLMPRPVGDLGPQTRIDVVVGWDPRP